MKYALVTGGTSGIGKAVVEMLLSETEKWTVFCVGRSNISSIKHLRLKHLRADLRNSDDITNLIQTIPSLTKKLDLIVHSAGEIFEPEGITQIESDILQDSYQLHCIAPLLISVGLSDLLNSERISTIVNLGSVYGLLNDTDVTAYTMAKSAVPCMTKLLAKKLAPATRVNCILPGHIDTPMTQSAPSEFVEDIIRQTPLKRLGNANEIANLIKFLASENSTFITGSAIVVDGGFLLK